MEDENKNPPKNIDYFNRELEHLSKKLGKSISRIKRDIANTVVAQMLPDNSIIKGGSALSLKYPMSDTRETKDLDLVFGDDLDTFLSEFAKHLEQGWAGFTGVLKMREKRTDRTTMPDGFVMTPVDVSIFYKGHSFKTIRMDVVPEMNGEVRDAIEITDSHEFEIFEALHFPRPVLDKIIPPQNQLAQKLNGIANPMMPRPRDFVDVQLILKHDGENINYPKLYELTVREYEITDRNYPLDMEDIRSRNKESYEAMRERYNYSYLLPFEDALKICDKLIGDSYAYVESKKTNTSPPMPLSPQ
jgi:predicted nucleotidyltransferase component of viral defense system